jgi:alcohol dehydrogenase class IV/quinol monooxygenase YgiN
MLFALLLLLTMFNVSRALSRSIRRSSFSTSRLFSSLSDQLAVHVKGSLTPASEQSFLKQTLHNAMNSNLEAGVNRFDVLKCIDEDDSAGDFLLVEVYKNKDIGPVAHKETAHYNEWRETVADMMAVPRSATKFRTLYPYTDKEWSTSPSASHVSDDGATACIYYETIQPFDSSQTRGLLAVLVDIYVKSEDIDAFKAATYKNCESSVKEGGVTRFDFLQDCEDDNHFQLVEVYNDVQAPAMHKETSHYHEWRVTVADMMAQPRKASKYVTIWPAPLYWHTSATSTQPREGHTISSLTSEQEIGLSGLSVVPNQMFSFLSPKLVFGRNVVNAAIPAAMKQCAVKNPYVVTGKNGLQRYKDILDSILGSDYNYNDKHCAITGEPTIEDARTATAAAIAGECDSVIAIGGGSALDLGKAVAALISNKDEDVMEFVEVFGAGKTIPHEPVPMIAVPTTAGTGSETTKNAVLKSNQHKLKASMRADGMLPNIAIIDPILMISCPQDVTAHVGLDTLCQVIEPYISNAANPFTDALAKEAITRVARSLREVVANGSNIEAREDMAIASTMGGIALANSKLGTVHGYAGVLGGMFEVAPHGALCAALLPHVFRKNAIKLSEVVNGNVSEKDAGLSIQMARVRLQRIVDVSCLLTNNQQATYLDGCAWLDAMVKDLQVPGLSKLCGMQMDHVDMCVDATAGASSTKGNPIMWDKQELKEVLLAAM